MKGIINKFTDSTISFLEDGVQELQIFEIALHIKPEYFRKGRAELNVTDNVVTFVKMEEEQKATDAPKKPENYIVKISGKDYMTYEGLLNKAHEKKEAFSMVVTEKWVSEDMKMAWCMIRLTAADRTFDGFGSSTPENTGKMTQSHPVEMAHTRAKGRALRDYLNIGQAMAEELKDANK